MARPRKCTPEFGPALVELRMPPPQQLTPSSAIAAVTSQAGPLLASLGERRRLVRWRAPRPLPHKCNAARPPCCARRPPRGAAGQVGLHGTDLGRSVQDPCNGVSDRPTHVPAPHTTAGVSHSSFPPCPSPCRSTASAVQVVVEILQPGPLNVRTTPPTESLAALGRCWHPFHSALSHSLPSLPLTFAGQAWPVGARAARAG